MAINTGEDLTGTISNVGTVDFNKDITLKGKIEGEGTYNNKAAMTVGDMACLNIAELKNADNATVQLGNLTEQTLNTVITGGTLKIVGDISTDTDKLGADKTDIAQNRTLILTAGTLTKKLEGAGNLTFATDMNINADNIATSGTNTLMEGKTLTFTAGTLAEKLGGGGNIVIGGDVSSTLGNLANTGTLTVNDNSILTLTGENTLTKNIAGAGTTKANGTLTVLTDQTIAGTLELGEGSALKLTDGSTGLNTLTAGTLKGTTNLYLGVDMLNNVADKVAAGVVAENTTINIQHINITREPAGSVSGEQTVKYLTENGTAPTHGSYTVNGAADGKILLSTTDYIYTFTNGDERGSIKYTVEALDVTLKEFFVCTKHEGSVDIGTFSLTGDNAYTGTAADMGAPTQANRELTLYLNGHKVEKTAGAAAAMTVSTGNKRLNLDGGEEGSADLNFDVKEGGVLAVSGSTALTGNIMNAGEVAFDGIVTASGELTGAGKYTNSNCLIVADAAKLQMTEGLKNEGVLNLGGSAASELGTDIAGKGTINILGTLTSGKNIENKVVVAAGVMLSNTGTISGAVDNAGTMFTTANGITGGLTNNSPNFFLTGGDLGSDITGTGSISIIGNVTNSGGNLIAQYALSLLYGIALTTNADALVIDGDAGTISNSGRMTLTGGTLQEMVRGDTGSLTIEGDVVALNNITQRFLHINPGKSLDMAGNGKKLKIEEDIDNKGTLNIAAGDLLSNVANSGTVNLTDGTLANQIEGEGSIVIEGAVSSTAANLGSTGTLTVNNGSVLELMAGELAKAITNSGTVKLNGAALGGKHITSGILEFAQDLTIAADYVAADTNKIDQGVTLTLTAGTLTKKLEGGGNLVFAGNVSTDVDNIAVAGTTVVNSGTLTLTDGVLVKKLEGAGNIAIGGEVETEWKNLANTGTLTVNDNSILALTGDVTLEKDIAGAGTTKVNGTMTVLTDQTVAGTLELGGGSTLKLTDGSTGLNTLTVGTLKGGTDLYLGVDMSTNTGDKVAAGVVAENAQINVQHINIVKDRAAGSGYPSGWQTVQYLTENGSTPTRGDYTLNGEEGKFILTTGGGNTYTFENGEAKGSIKYTVEALNVTLKDFFEGTKHEGSVDIGTFSLTGDNTYTETAADMGAPTQANRELTLYLNGHKVEKTAETATAMTVSTGDKRLNLDGGEEGSADLNYDVKEGGVLAVSGSTA
ncbi:MAG: hypothetical protein MJ041_04420, partial [Acidaminococcaceae bacterium]|nr:hypothetical protein [Acidaminococcaceae bacterium]